MMLEGVCKVRGVFEKPFCAGLGVIWTKSEKSKLFEGVLGPPKVASRPWICWGVVITEEGRARFLGGGVEGGCIRAREVGFAGDGEVARYNSKSAPSFTDFPFLSSRRAPFRLRPGGGVRGEDLMLNEWAGKVSSSSSDGDVKPEEISSEGWL